MSDGSPGGGSSEETAPDLILLASSVISMSETPGPADGVAIRAGRIERLLARDEVEGLRGATTEVVDLGDRAILPGFVDVHAHVEVACRAAFGTVDCRAPECSTVEEVLETLSDGLATTRDGWVVGQANLFFDRKLAEGRLPTREELDRVSRTVPIALRAGGHITVLNSRALELAGIDRAYREPEHSVTGKPIVVRDDAGDPIGVVKEMDNLLPIPEQDEATIREALRDGIATMFTRHGVTTIGEISESVTGIGCMDELARNGELGTRMRIYLWAPGTMSLEDAVEWPSRLDLRADEDDVRVQGVKLFADGGYSAASAAVKRPYLHVPGHMGDIALPRDLVREALPATRDAGLQLAIHANGDRAQEWLCEVIAEAGGAPAAPRLRTRIEHAGNFMPDPATAEAWRRAGIVPVPQPVFLYTFGDYFPDYLGDYGLKGRFPFAGLLEDGWRLSGSCDVWVGSEREATNPLFGVWCCVRRQSYTGATLDGEQAISVEQALRMHTIDAAWVLGEDGVKGSLEPGKLADVIVLDRDPRAVAVDDLPQLRVERVYLGGRLIRDTAG